MSVMSATIQPDRVIFLTDAAIYSPDGALTSLHTKTFQIPSIPAVFSSRGRAVAFPAFMASCLQQSAICWDNFVVNLRTQNPRHDSDIRALHLVFGANRSTTP